MKKNYLVALGFVVLGSWLPASVRPVAASSLPAFDCSLVFYQSQQTTGDSNIYELVYDGTNDPTWTLMSSSLPNGLNGLAYNPIDDYLYGNNTFDSAHELYRIGSDGSSELVIDMDDILVAEGYGSIVDHTKTWAATFNDEGHYIVAFVDARGVGVAVDTHIMVLDLSTETPELVSIAKVYHEDSSAPAGEVQFPDISFDSATQTLFGYDHYQQHMVRVDPQTGALTKLPTDHTTVGWSGGPVNAAQWFTPDGQWFTLGQNADTQTSYDTFYRADKTSGALTEIFRLDTPMAGSGDGAVCRKSPSLDLYLDNETVTTGDSVTVNFRINNPTGTDFTDAIISLPMPIGTYVDGSLQQVGSLAEAVFSNGVLTISGVDFAGNQSSIFSVDFLIDEDAEPGQLDLESELAISQWGYPSSYDSDNPDTVEELDPTPITVVLAATDPEILPETGLSVTSLAVITGFGLIMGASTTTRLRRQRVFER